MADQIEQGSGSEPNIAGEAMPSDLARRKFAKLGFGASGVLMTLVSRPVLGDVVCKSPSGFLSANQSTHGPAPICEGRSPGYWATHEGWPIAKTALFKNLFSCKLSAWYAHQQIGKLIEPRQEDKNNLVRHIVAALLNAKMGWTPFLPEQKVKVIFKEWETNGSFSPSANVHWNAEQIVTYLKATQA